MKTDSIFYRIFQQYPRSFFELLNRPASDADNYEFTSVEVKQLAFRLDGIFLPTPDEATEPFYVTEVQFQADEELYYRIFAELFLYLRQYKPANPWRVVVIYPKRSIEREIPHQFRELLNLSRVTRIYLNELETSEDNLGASLIKLVVESEAEAIESAKRLIDKAQDILPSAPIQRDIIDLIETIVVYKLPQASREKIAEMLGLTDLKQTRFYQEAFAEGREEGVQQTQQEFIQRLLNRGNSPEDIAQLLDIPLETVQQFLN
ncbi:Rpn family recombination-promoting nuclease/putative transposase [Spirulina sp. CS-785/01]|nr:Rpn family recombination-promoting nuclease/putative transposase [Spirulina sp. CS-785/01]MDB9316036.1 Rpn family recombination-promoting nuclease/putative transposase [Spirulina sp. CS-785/01]